MISFILNFVKVAKFIFVLLPDLLWLIRKLYDATFGNKTLAKECVQGMACPVNLKSSVEKSLRKGKGPIQ